MQKLNLSTFPIFFKLFINQNFLIQFRNWNVSPVDGTRFFSEGTSLFQREIRRLSKRNNIKFLIKVNALEVPGKLPHLPSWGTCSLSIFSRNHVFILLGTKRQDDDTAIPKYIEADMNTRKILRQWRLQREWGLGHPRNHPALLPFTQHNRI